MKTNIVKSRIHISWKKMNVVSLSLSLSGFLSAYCAVIPLFLFFLLSYFILLLFFFFFFRSCTQYTLLCHYFVICHYFVKKFKSFRFTYDQPSYSLISFSSLKRAFSKLRQHNATCFNLN